MHVLRVKMKQHRVQGGRLAVILQEQFHTHPRTGLAEHRIFCRAPPRLQVATFCVALLKLGPQCALTPSHPWIHAGHIVAKPVAGGQYATMASPPPLRVPSRLRWPGLVAQAATAMGAYDV